MGQITLTQELLDADSLSVDDSFIRNFEFEDGDDELVLNVEPSDETLRFPVENLDNAKLNEDGAEWEVEDDEGTTYTIELFTVTQITYK